MNKVIALLVVGLSFHTFALSEGNFYYTVSGNQATITGFVNESNLGDVTIPNTIGGYPVVAIGAQAFQDCTSLTGVVIPNSVTIIGNNAFDYTSLVSVIIPESVTRLGTGVFQDCRLLEVVQWPKSLGSNIPGWTFHQCYQLKYFIYSGSGITSSNGAFSYSSNVKVVSSFSYYDDFKCYFEGDDCLGSIQVSAVMITPKIMKVNYIQKTAQLEQVEQCEFFNKVGWLSNKELDELRKLATNNILKVKTRAVAFKDGVRRFANIVPVRSGENVPNGSEVAVNTTHEFTWNVPEDWDIDLAKVRVEILVQEGQLLPQELVTIPANGEKKAMTITVNEISRAMAFNALLWCYAEGDKNLTVENGYAYVNGHMIYNASYYNDSYWDYPYATPRLNYLYGKMGYKVLSGDDLVYVRKMTRTNFVGFVGNEPNYSSGERNGLYRQVSVKIEE